MKSKFQIFEKKDRKHFKVIIFGSSRVKMYDNTYKKVWRLAELLGERGVDVVTGGGPGLMQAANEGHREGSKLGRMYLKSSVIGFARQIASETSNPHLRKISSDVKL